jgi:hypothetical protein
MQGSLTDALEKNQALQVNRRKAEPGLFFKWLKMNWMLDNLKS